MRSALSLLDNGDPSGLELLEAQLLGCLVLAPYNRLDSALQTLRPADFSSPHRGLAFEAIMAERRPEVGLVVNRLEREGHRPPQQYTGWADAVSRMLDVALVDDDAVSDAVRAIKEASLARRLQARTNAAA